MTFSNFEKYAAGKLNNHSSQVDVEGLWNEVLPHVQNNNGRKRGLIWFFFAGLLLSIAGILALSDNNSFKSNNEISALSIVEPINEKNDAEPDNSGAKEMTAFVSTVDENLITETNTPLVSDSKNTPSQKNNSSKKAESKNQNSKVSKKAFQTNNTNATNSIAVDSGNNENTEKGGNESVVAIEEIEPIAESSTIENHEATPTTNNEIELNENTETIIADTFEMEEDIALVEDNKLVPPPPPNKFKIKFGVGVYAGLSSSFGSLKDKDGMNNDYLQLRLKTEEQLETIQMGLDVVARSEYGVYLKTGVQYSRIARKFSLTSNIVTTDTVDGIQKIYINNNTMDTTYVYGPVPVTTTTSYNKITYNYFHLVDIPLLLGYSYSNDDWSFGVEAGPLFNISTKTKGEIMQNDVEIYDMTEDQLDWFTDNIGVSFMTSINVAYLFNENFQVYVSPTARFESVFSTDANPIAQKQAALGINIGARYFIGY